MNPSFFFFFLFFHLSSPGYSGLMFIDSMASYHLNTQHYQKAKKTQGFASLKPPQIKMRAGTETTTGTSHDTPHDIHQTHTYIYIYICIPTYTNARIHTPPVDITQSTMQSAMPRRRHQDMHRTTATHIPMSETIRRHTGDMVINQHGLRQQLDTIGLQAITWANSSPYVCCHLDDIFRPQ